MSQRLSQEDEGSAPSLEPRDQIAALPARLTSAGQVEVLLVTSRETRRWIIPKGWPMDGFSDDRAAGVEALEEAGVKGRLLADPIGRYAYWQRGRLGNRHTQVDVFLMRVDKVLKTWKEKDQRERRWFDVVTAADLVQEAQLAEIFLRLAGHAEGRRLLGLGKTKGGGKSNRSDPDAVPSGL